MYNSWSLKELKHELKKEINSGHTSRTQLRYGTE